MIEQCACFTDRVHRSRNQPQKEKISAITIHDPLPSSQTRAQEL
jgi:hypothetical protein